MAPGGVDDRGPSSSGRDIAFYYLTAPGFEDEVRKYAKRKGFIDANIKFLQNGGNRKVGGTPEVLARVVMEDKDVADMEDNDVADRSTRAPRTKGSSSSSGSSSQLSTPKPWAMHEKPYIWLTTVSSSSDDISFVEDLQTRLRTAVEALLDVGIGGLLKDDLEDDQRLMSGIGNIRYRVSVVSASSSSSSSSRPGRGSRGNANAPGGNNSGESKRPTATTTAALTSQDVLIKAAVRHVTKQFPRWKVDLSLDGPDLELVWFVFFSSSSTQEAQQTPKCPSRGPSWCADLVLRRLPKKGEANAVRNKKMFSKLPSEWRSYHLLEEVEEEEDVGDVDVGIQDMNLNVEGLNLKDEDLKTPPRKVNGDASSSDISEALAPEPSTCLPIKEHEKSEKIIPRTTGTSPTKKSKSQSHSQQTSGLSSTKGCTLRPSTAYLLLEAAGCGDCTTGFSVLDCFGGQGTIAMEAALQYPLCKRAVTSDADAKQSAIAKKLSIRIGLGCSTSTNSPKNEDLPSSNAAAAVVPSRNGNAPLFEVHTADARQLPYPDEAFDFLVVDLPFGNKHELIGAASLSSLLADFLAEAARVLKRFGRLCVLCTRMHARQLLAKVESAMMFKSVPSSSSTTIGNTNIFNSCIPNSNGEEAQARPVIIGGWPAAVVVLERSDVAASARLEQKQEHQASSTCATHTKSCSKKRNDTSSQCMDCAVVADFLFGSSSSCSSKTDGKPSKAEDSLTDFLMDTWPDHFPTAAACKKTLKRGRVWIVKETNHESVDHVSTAIVNDGKSRDYSVRSGMNAADKNKETQALVDEVVPLTLETAQNVLFQEDDLGSCRKISLGNRKRRLLFFPDYPVREPYKSSNKLSPSLPSGGQEYRPGIQNVEAEAPVLARGRGWFIIQKPPGMPVHGGLRTVQNIAAAIVQREDQSRSFEKMDESRHLTSIPFGACLNTLPQAVSGPILVATDAEVAWNFVKACNVSHSTAASLSLTWRAVLQHVEDHAQHAWFLKKTSTGDHDKHIEAKNHDVYVDDHGMIFPTSRLKLGKIHRTTPSRRFGFISELEMETDVKCLTECGKMAEKIVEHFSTNAGASNVSTRTDSCTPILGSNEEVRVRRGHLYLRLQRFCFKIISTEDDSTKVKVVDVESLDNCPSQMRFDKLFAAEQAVWDTYVVPGQQG